MDIPDNIRISNHILSTRDEDNWVESLKGLPHESDEELYHRWLRLLVDKQKNDQTLADRQNINNILSWLVPIIILALGFFITSFVAD